MLLQASPQRLQKTKPFCFRRRAFSFVGVAGLKWLNGYKNQSSEKSTHYGTGLMVGYSFNSLVVYK
jgi:hypothetical protein